MSFREKLYELARKSQEIRDANDEAFTQATEQFHQAFKNARGYFLVAPLVPLVTDVINAANVNAITYFLFQSLRKIWCTPEEGENVCSDEELQRIQKQSSIAELTYFSTILALQSLWVVYIAYKKRQDLFAHNAAFYRKLEEKLSAIEKAVEDIMAQIFIPHKLFLIMAIHAFGKETMSDVAYIFSFLTPSILLALAASSELLKVGTLFKPGKWWTVAKNVLITDMIGTSYRIAGQVDFSSRPQEDLTRWTGKDLMLAPDTLAIVDGSIGLTWGAIVTSKNFIPWYTKPALIKFGMFINELAKMYLFICMMLLIVALNKEQLATSLGRDVSIIVWILTACSAIFKLVVDRYLKVPLSGQQQDSDNLPYRESVTRPLLNPAAFYGAASSDSSVNNPSIEPDPTVGANLLERAGHCH